MNFKLCLVLLFIVSIWARGYSQSELLRGRSNVPTNTAPQKAFPNTLEGFLEECLLKYSNKFDCDCAALEYKRIVNDRKKAQLDFYRKYLDGEISKIEQWCNEGLKVSSGKLMEVNLVGRSRNLDPFKSVTPENAPADAIDACKLVDFLKKLTFPKIEDIETLKNSGVIVVVGNEKTCLK